MRRNLIAGSIVVATMGSFTICFASAAAAGTSSVDGSGSVSDGTVTATATSSSSGSSGSNTPASSSQGSVGSSGASPPPPPCYYVPASPSVSASLSAAQPEPGPGTWYTWYCTTPTGFLNNPQPARWWPAGTAPGAAPSVPALLQQAIGEAALVDPTIVLNPPGDQVVNLAGWLAISPGQWSTVVASATAGGVITTVTATPQAVLWNLGDGDSITCPGPGVLYDPSKPAADQSTYCSYLWPRSSADAPGGVFQITATIEYEVTTAVIGAADPTPDLGIHAGPTQRIDVAVSEIEALGTSP